VTGLVYAGALLLSAIAIRFGMQSGHIAILFLFVVVWTTDIAAYFVGRALGGPKLAPAISPKKTWSGALGGCAAAIGAAIGFISALGGLGSYWRVGLLALGLSIVSQIGDLFESFVKRRFDAKDSSGLIPGHGGVMDRLDGFVTAAVALALIDAARTWSGAPARDLFGW
jgi:phosphatidate cytidylyltransferase